MSNNTKGTSQQNDPQKHPAFFSSAAVEGNKCVICKSVHCGISAGMFAYCAGCTVHDWGRLAWGRRGIYLGVTLFFLGIGAVHFRMLGGLAKDLKEKGESYPQFYARQTRIFAARHGLSMDNLAAFIVGKKKE